MDFGDWVNLFTNIALWLIGLSAPPLLAALIRLTLSTDRLGNSIKVLESMLGRHEVKLDEQQKTLNSHSERLARHDERLEDHERRLVSVKR